jgi:hypothetical protein
VLLANGEPYPPVFVLEVVFVVMVVSAKPEAGQVPTPGVQAVIICEVEIALVWYPE